MELHDSLRAARKRTKISGAKLAEQLNMSAQAYRRYERGEVIPSATTILKLSEILRVSPTALMLTGGEEDEPQAPREEINQIDLDLREGQTLQIYIEANVVKSKPENDDTLRQENYAPKRYSPASDISKNIKKA